MELDSSSVPSTMIDSVSKKFSAVENLYLNHTDSTESRLFRFLRIWCLKESYLKAIGIGLSIPLDSISFQINSAKFSSADVASDTRLFVDNVKQELKFTEMVYENHLLTACTDLKVKMIDLNILHVIDPSDFCEKYSVKYNSETEIDEFVSNYMLKQ